MNFGSKLKQLREDRGLTQTELADKLSATLKVISSYETKDTCPHTQDMYRKIVEFFDVDTNFLLTIEDNFVLDSTKKFGYSGRKDAENLMDNLSGFFIGGSPPEEGKDKLFNATAKICYEAKLKSKKYGKNKSRR